ncbi:MAG: DinB family protein [Cyclobacteriaceae bacterium]
MQVGLKTMNRPKEEEYAPFYQGYIAAVPEGDIIPMLQTQQESFMCVLNNLSTADLFYSYSDNKWTVAQVLGHIIDTERLMSSRALQIARGEIQELPGFDQDEYVNLGNFEKRSVYSFSQEFQGLRMSNIALFSSFDENDLSKKGVASGVIFTVRSLVFITAGHLAHHLNILSEKYNIQ